MSEKPKYRYIVRSTDAAEMATLRQSAERVGEYYNPATHEFQAEIGKDFPIVTDKQDLANMLYQDKVDALNNAGGSIKNIEIHAILPVENIATRPLMEWNSYDQAHLSQIPYIVSNEFDLLHPDRSDNNEDMLDAYDVTNAEPIEPMQVEPLESTPVASADDFEQLVQHAYPLGERLTYDHDPIQAFDKSQFVSQKFDVNAYTGSKASINLDNLPDTDLTK